MKVYPVFLIIIVLFLTACLGISTEIEQPLEIKISPAATNLPADPTPNPTAVPGSDAKLMNNSPTPEPADPLLVGSTQTPAYPGPEAEQAGTPEMDAQPYPGPQESSTKEPYPGPAGAQNPGEVTGYRIVNTYPHDPAAYTQGLVVDADPDYLLEGTGLRGESSIRRVDLATGAVVQIINMPQYYYECAFNSTCTGDYFGEGITTYGDTLYQLTWKANKGFTYDPDTFEQIGSFTYPHEGWGITHDGQSLFVSDGTHILHIWDPQTMVEIGTLEVMDNGQPVHKLNELEYVRGEILANVWQTDYIARISPQSGEILGWIDLTGLLPADIPTGSADVLNGIAYDQQNDRLYVTGKRWPFLYEIELVPGE